ncbi:hypothetical protein [Polynucleobacter sp. UB-Piko-W3]|uniref:hypothetical protein n=1 Tax=Polynucleobacter sp. UB-Piko-W3 TaxID=1819735 RepID=UPI001C0E15F7|nr:hypothetical protein [Polynucleobacter sp. UB-Piko-W3]MBU3555008.1 hypothetical protein [Polynucleobacter sp. UB-Piko-W3]
MIVAKAKALAKIILKGIAILLALLILLYAGFKFWEYQTIEGKRAEKTAFLNQQKTKFEDFIRDEVSYAPLMVGTSSLEYVQRGNRDFIFSYLLAADYKAFQNAMEDSVPMIYVGKQILGSGCKKQACSEAEAAFVIDPDSGKYYAALSQDGKTVYYGVEDGKSTPAAFEKWHGNQTSGGAK